MNDQKTNSGIKEEIRAKIGRGRKGSTGNIENIRKRKREKMEERKKIEKEGQGEEE